jgi:putative heme-binding domain-containing protein
VTIARTLMWAAAVAAIASGAVTSAAQSPRPKPLENPTTADLERGASLFVASCARCHGVDGSGGTGPPLARPRLQRAADEAAIIEIIMDGVPGTSMPAGWVYSESEVVLLAAHVRSLGRRPLEPLPGDPVAGRAVYTRLSCDGCHIVDGAGTAVGPELTNIGALRGAGFLRESLLDPGAARPERSVPYEPFSYPAYAIVRAKPRGAAEVTGLWLNEDSFTIQLRDDGGRVRSFRKAELERLQVERNTSRMPSYRDTLTSRDADDLVAYLMTLGSPQ